MYMTISPYMYMRLYIGCPPCTRCGMRERERERKETDRQRERERERDRQTEKDRQRERERAVSALKAEGP